MEQYSKNPYDMAQTSVVDEDYDIIMKMTTLVESVENLSEGIFTSQNYENDYVNAIIEDPYKIDALDLNLLRIGELSKMLSPNFRQYYTETLHRVTLAPFISYRNIVAHYNVKDVDPRFLYKLCTSHLSKLNSAISDFRIYCASREDVQTVETETSFATKNRIYSSYTQFCESNRDGHYIHEIPVDVRKRLDKIFAHQVLNRSNHPQYVFNERLLKKNGSYLMSRIKPGVEFDGSDEQVDLIINLITESSDIQFLYYREPTFWVLKDE